MSEWEAVEGGTLLIPSGPNNHLFIIAIKSSDFDEHEDKDMCLLVNITSIKNGVYHDPTCILKAGCHPFIEHDSYITYKDARLDSEATLEKFVESGYFLSREPVSNDLLQKIASGVSESKHTTGHIKKLLSS